MPIDFEGCYSQSFYQDGTNTSRLLDSLQWNEVFDPVLKIDEPDSWDTSYILKSFEGYKLITSKPLLNKIISVTSIQLSVRISIPEILDFKNYSWFWISAHMPKESQISKKSHFLLPLWPLRVFSVSFLFKITKE